METANIKINSIIDNRCKSCIIKTYQRLFEKYNIDETQHLYFFMLFHETMLKHKNLPSPEIQQMLNRKFCEIINVTDPFLEEKTRCNQIALDLYKQWKPTILNSTDPFNLAIRLAIAGNIMDYGANNNFDLLQTINNVVIAKFALDDSLLLKQKLKNATKILYLGDNAGEIVFDKLFIETIMHNNIVYAVKGAPVFNDATINDAHDIGMDLVADVISNGYDAPSTILNKCSWKFREIFKTADIIISKGQGNMQGLINQNDPRIFYLLMAKCDVIADILKVDKGSFIVYNQNN